MAEAKKCDRCGKLYDIATDQMPYHIKAQIEDKLLDTCPDCSYDLEDWMENKKRFPKTIKKKRGNYNIPPEVAEKRRQRQIMVMAIRNQLIKTEGIHHHEALRKANQLLKEKGEPYWKKKLKPKPQTTEETTKGTHTYRCTMCGKGEFDGPYKVCKNCKSDLNMR